MLFLWRYRNYLALLNLLLENYYWTINQLEQIQLKMSWTTEVHKFRWLFLGHNGEQRKADSSLTSYNSYFCTLFEMSPMRAFITATLCPLCKLHNKSQVYSRWHSLCHKCSKVPPPRLHNYVDKSLMLGLIGKAFSFEQLGRGN